MKTFKIVALQIIEQDRAKNIPLADGLIINKEDDKGSWIIEAYIDEQYQALFEDIRSRKEKIEVRVIITHAANDPAPFTVRVHAVKPVGDHISVLFIGILSKRRDEYLELMLDDLIKEGLSGEPLLVEFKKRMKMPQQAEGKS